MKNFFLTKQGFTVLEIVMAMAIFVTTTVVVSDIFIRNNKAQRQTQGIQATAADARFFLESMTRTIRVSEIDYAYYGGTIGNSGNNYTTDVLAVRTVDNVPVRFSRQTGAVCPDPNFHCLAICFAETCVDGTADWLAITPRGINMTLLTFMVHPWTSPFEYDPASGNYRSNKQPLVTVFSKIENTTEIESDRRELDIQTSVTSRVYKR